MFPISIMVYILWGLDRKFRTSNCENVVESSNRESEKLKYLKSIRIICYLT